MSDSKKKTNDFLKQGSILAFASILVRMIGLLYRIPLANMLGEEGNGIYGFAYTIYSLVLILSSYSLPLAVSKMVAAKTVQKEYKNAYKIFKNAMLFAIVIGAIAAGCLYFGADFFAGIAKYPGAQRPLRILAPTIFVVAILGVFRGFFQGKNTMVPTAFSQIFEQVINAFVSVFAAYSFMKAHSASEDISAYGASGSTLGTLMGSIAALLFLVFVYLIYRPVLKKQLHRDKSLEESNKEIYRMLFFTIMPVILSQTVYQISGTIDMTLFGNIMAAKNMDETVRTSLLGVYSSQYTVLLSVPLGIATAMGTSMIPSIVSSFTTGKMREVKLKVKSVVKFNMLLAFPAAVGLTVLSKPIIVLLFPSLVAYKGVASSLLLLGSIALVFYALSTVTSGVLQAVNQMRVPVTHSAISLGIHIVLVYVLLQFTDMGVYALIAGNVTFPLVVCILNWYSVKKYLKYKQEVKTTFVIPCLASIIMGIACYITYAISYRVLHRNAISVILAIFIAIVVYFVGLLLLRAVDEEELKGMPMGRTMYTVARKLHLIK